MQNQTGFGEITSLDVQNELVSRGIIVGVAPPDGQIPDGPDEAIVIVGPGDRIDYDGRYLPIYPTPVVTEVEEEERILPYLPDEEEKPANRWLLGILGIAVFALIALGGEEPPAPRRPRKRPEPEEAYEEYYSEEED